MTDKARCLFRVWAAQLAGTEFAPALELLRLFAFGTLAEYKGAPHFALQGDASG